MISPTFKRLVDQIVKNNELLAKQIKGTLAPNSDYEKNSPYHFGVALKDQLTIPFQQFNRYDLNSYLRGIYTSLSSRQKEVISAHFQLAFIAALERAMTNRYKTPIRALVHAAGKFLAHGGEKSIFRSFEDRMNQLEAFRPNEPSENEPRNEEEI